MKNDKPLIGLTTFHTDSGRGYLYQSVTETYIHALANAGALPVLVPLTLPEDDLERLRTRLDAILFTGGGDLDPALYGGQMHPSVHEIDPDRDRTEMHLARQVVETGQPFLGICRGLQVVNVALGGTLYADIQAEFPGALKHDVWEDGAATRAVHPVRIEEGTALAGILGQPMVSVNSLHHQGIRELAPALTPAAYAPDGLIEAFELEGHRFGLAVQWHPERLSGVYGMPGLFEAFVSAARDGRG